MEQASKYILMFNRILLSIDVEQTLYWPRQITFYYICIDELLYTDHTNNLQIIEQISRVFLLKKQMYSTIFSLKWLLAIYLVFQWSQQIYVSLCVTSPNTMCTIKSFFKSTQYNLDTRNARTLWTHVHNPTPMSIFEDWDRKFYEIATDASLSMVMSSTTKCIMLLNSRIFTPMKTRTQNLRCYRDSCNHQNSRMCAFRMYN